eukprot:c15881_g1_i1 orf=183-2441(+)
MAMDPAIFQFDPDFEFSAPHFYDFTSPETASEVAEAERWFETSASHGASPFSVRSRDLGLTPNRIDEEFDGEQMDTSSPARDGDESLIRFLPDAGGVGWGLAGQHNNSEVKEFGDFDLDLCSSPTTRALSGRQKPMPTTPGSLPAKRLHTDMSKKAPLTDKPATRFCKSHFSRRTQTLSQRDTNHGDKSGRHEVQAIKKQKLEGGRLKQIMKANDEKCSAKTPASLTVPRAFNFLTEKRWISGKGADNLSASKVGKSSSPFVSMAEKVQRFQMKTRESLRSRVLSNDDCGSHAQEKSKLKLTKPKEPEFETSQRVRPARVKSTAELEAEMLAKMPKFKARPLNKKILEAPTLPALPKSIPIMPEFQEFHLRTMDRALQHGGSASLASVLSVDSATLEECRHRRKSAPSGEYIEPREPRLETAARARPPKVKSSEEREQEELAKIPKFKARPLDKKIFWSRGDLGLFRNTKRQVTTPVEFHFATDERIHNQPQIPLDLFSKLSLNHQQENQPPKQTKLEPFHLLTEDRGHKKGQRMLMELKHNQLREQEQRIPKANPLPCTTDYPEVPPKPDPKECTIPRPFYLESVARHQEEMLRVAEENRRIEKEEAERRKFHAQPVSCIGPVFVPERSRKPLTEVQEFAFQVDTRAVERADFDKKVAEKQNSYKRFREEFEAAKKADEERLIKSLRRTMVPQALPLPVFEKPFIPRRCSKELTRPRSPKLSVTHRRERRSSLTFRRQSMTFSIQKRLQMR